MNGQFAEAQAKQPASGTSDSSVRVVIETASIIIGMLINLLLIPRHLSSDAVHRFQALNQLLSAHTLSTVPYSLVGPLFATPLWLLGKLYKTPQWWIQYYNWLLLALGLVVFYVLLRNRIDRSILRTFLLLIVFASLCAQQVTDFDGEIFTALLVMIGALLAAQRRGKIGWPLAILGVVNTPATLLGLGLMSLKQIASSRRLRYVLVPLGAVAIIGAENWLRRGAPLATGYEGNVGFRTVMPYSGLPGFSYPIFFGLLSILFSFGKGLIFYMPGLFLPVRKRLLALGDQGQMLYAAYQLWLAFLIGLVLVYSHWWAWYGGWYWGPRFFLAGSLIACFALALAIKRPSASLIVNLITLVVLVLSFWVGINGVVFDQNTLASTCQANNYALETLCHYTPEFSALWRPFVVYEPLSTRSLVYIGCSVLVFAYVAFPLLRVIARQLAEGARHLWAIYGRQAWGI
jgi:hypothetical protein